MFEFLLLSSIVLIVFSQTLPRQEQQNQDSLPEADPIPGKDKKLLVSAVRQIKKQPRRKSFERAA